MTDPTVLSLALASIPGMGPRRFRSLVARFGGVEAAWSAPRQDLAFWARSCPELACRIVDSRNDASVTLRIERLLASARARGMEAVSFESERYPSRLREIPDPPSILWTQGEVAPAARRVAIVGTRRATSYGRRVARDLCRDLAQRGVEVVSGMAHGIDAAAHDAMVKLRGRTLAVLACGLDVTLGSDRDALRDAVLGAGGAIVSEYNPGTKACAERFPARNRIISGLSDAVVVIEAPARSGALITAEFALEQGREVLAVPGGIYAGTSEGCNQLIKDGAAVVARPTDVAEAIGLGPSASGRAAQLRLAGGLDDTRSDPPGGAKDTESTVFGALRQGQTAFEEIVAQTGIEPVECARALGMLEIRGLCRRHPDGSYEIT